MLRFFLVLLAPFLLDAQIQKIEPPFWWEGMNDTSLMITIYGENISKYSISSEKLDIVKTIVLENPNYIFVYLDLKDVAFGQYSLFLSKKGKSDIKINYELKKELRILLTVKDTIVRILSI